VSDGRNADYDLPGDGPDFDAGAYRALTALLLKLKKYAEKAHKVGLASVTAYYMFP
jgi:hypothetical protein